MIVLSQFPYDYTIKTTVLYFYKYNYVPCHFNCCMCNYPLFVYRVISKIRFVQAELVILQSENKSGFPDNSTATFFVPSSHRLHAISPSRIFNASLHLGLTNRVRTELHRICV